MIIDVNNALKSKCILLVYVLGNYVYYKCRIPVVKQILYIMYRVLNLLVVEVLFNNEIDGRIKIGHNFRIDHPFGIIINPSVVIGDNVVIRHQVTIGNKGTINSGNPIIGNNVNIGAGAKIIGGISIGNNVSIGANSVVTHDIPDNVVVAGVPAKIIK